MSLKRSIGARVRQLREERRLTQDQLAEKIERSVDAISALERGVMLPSLNTVERLAEALHVPMAAFFDLTLESDPNRSALVATLIGQASKLDDATLQIAVEQVASLARKRG